MPLRARKVLTTAQMRRKNEKSRNAHKEASRGLYVEASLTLAEVNQACEKENMLLFLNFANKTFGMIFWFCRSYGPKAIL